MPELPDVEGYRRQLAELVPGLHLRGVSAPAPAALRNRRPQAMGRALKGRRLDPPVRHGKWLYLPTAGGPTIVWHFGMTGRPEVVDAGEPYHAHDRVVFTVDGRELRLHMMRMLGGVWLARDTAEREQVTGELGPDALHVSEAGLRRLLSGRRGGIKSALMNQAVLAGLGNLLADEVLWRAGIDPRRATAHLSTADVSRLHARLNTVLEEAVQAERVPPHPGWLTGARHDDDPQCPRCSTSLRTATVAGRRTWWCPTCQPAAMSSDEGG